MSVPEKIQDWWIGWAEDPERPWATADFIDALPNKPGQRPRAFLPSRTAAQGVGRSFEFGSSVRALVIAAVILDVIY